MTTLFRLFVAVLLVNSLVVSSASAPGITPVAAPTTVALTTDAVREQQEALAAGLLNWATSFDARNTVWLWINASQGRRLAAGGIVGAALIGSGALAVHLGLFSARMA